MNPADERIRELLDKWLTSLELHLEYVTLNEEAYRLAQPWPEHDRPSRWVVEVARGKAADLRDQVEARIKMGDAKFAEALELMAFLVNLVGARVDRFIPLAELPAEPESQSADDVEDNEPTGPHPVLRDTATQEAVPPPVIAPPPPLAVDQTTVVRVTDSGEQRALKASVEATREMPRPAIKTDRKSVV